MWLGNGIKAPTRWSGVKGHVRSLWHAGVALGYDPEVLLFSPFGHQSGRTIPGTGVRG